MIAYLGLFTAAFLAATLLPAQSELLLTTLVISGDYAVPLLLLVASLGNTLGSMVNWALGYKVADWTVAKKADNKGYQRAHRLYQKYGLWTLLLSWVPIIGDPLTFIAGVFKANFWWFTIIVAFAKTMRYVVITLIALQWV